VQEERLTRQAKSEYDEKSECSRMNVFEGCSEGRRVTETILMIVIEQPDDFDDGGENEKAVNLRKD
jgi:hypothetical protein